MSKTRIVTTFAVLGIAALCLASALHWPTRWRILAYLPFVLIAVHAVIFLLWANSKNEKFMHMYRVYFVVPVVVHVVYGLMAVGAFVKASPLAGGPMLLLAIPLAPFISAPSVEERIEREEEKLYVELIEFGASSHESILPSSSPLPDKVEAALSRRFRKNPSDFSETFLNNWVQHYTSGRYPPGYPAFETVLLHPAITPESLLIFAQNQKENDNAEFVPMNPKAPIEAILICAESENTLVQLAAVESGRLDREQSEKVLWDMIESDKHAWEVRILRSSITTPPMLDRILDLETARGSAVVRHPAVSTEQLSKLSRHERSWTRKAVAEHPKANQETLERLLEDPIPDVAEAARLRLAGELSQ